jgi:uncharacterized protein
MRTQMKLGFQNHVLRSAVVAVLAMIALGCSITGAAAIDLASAKAQGLVGEQANGYLGIPKPPGSAEVQALVADINLKRRELYQQRAAALQPPVSLEQYEAIAGAKLVEAAKPGEYVRGSDGVWVQKK